MLVEAQWPAIASSIDFLGISSARSINSGASLSENAALTPAGVGVSFLNRKDFAAFGQ